MNASIHVEFIEKYLQIVDFLDSLAPQQRFLFGCIVSVAGWLFGNQGEDIYNYTTILKCKFFIAVACVLAEIFSIDQLYSTIHNDKSIVAHYIINHQNRLPCKCIIQNIARIHFFYHFSIVDKKPHKTILFWSSKNNQPCFDIWTFTLSTIHIYYWNFIISCVQKFYLWSPPITSKRWRCSKVNIVRIGNSSSVQLHK